MALWQELNPRSGAASEVERLANEVSVFRMPRAAMFLASVTHILSEEMGYRQSAEAGKGRFADGKPAPLLSYSLLEYLAGLDLSQCDVLEIGGGKSTAFWGNCARSVTTLESNADWSQHIRQLNPAATVEHVDGEQLGPRIAAFDRSFDIIVIDPAANRARCARAAIAKINKGGFIILDNSDWYPNTSRILRDAGLIQVDFHDFRPVHHYRATTTLFLTPEYRAKPRGARLPLNPIGGKVMPDHGWDAE